MDIFIDDCLVAHKSLVCISARWKMNMGESVQYNISSVWYSCTVDRCLWPRLSLTTALVDHLSRLEDDCAVQKCGFLYACHLSRIRFLIYNASFQCIKNNKKSLEFVFSATKQSFHCGTSVSSKNVFHLTKPHGTIPAVPICDSSAPFRENGNNIKCDRVNITKHVSKQTALSGSFESHSSETHIKPRNVLCTTRNDFCLHKSSAIA